jgi:pantoate--beta-alanine ligase
MKILRNISDLMKAISNINKLGFIPTMGGLHKGHLSLIKESQKKTKKTIVSIYVNPKQFNNKNDFLTYPRPLSKDLNLLRKLRVDFVFIPSSKDIYNKKRSKKITLKKNYKVLCARYRRGHFEGVIDVMDRFIKIIKPQFIFMGEKDFQQLLLIKDFIKNKYKSNVISCKTIRNKDGVALSSRNNLLTKKELFKAGLITNILKKVKNNIRKIELIEKYLHLLKGELTKKFKIKVEYLEFRNEINLRKYDFSKKNRLFIAYYFRKIRLIDNF